MTYKPTTQTFTHPAHLGCSVRDSLGDVSDGSPEVSLFIWHLGRPFYTPSLPHSEKVEAKGEQSLCHENEIQKLSQWFRCYSVFPEKRGRIYDIKASAWLASIDPHISTGWLWCPLPAAVLPSGYTRQLHQFTPPSEDLQTHDLFLFGGRIQRKRNIDFLYYFKKYTKSTKIHTWLISYKTVCWEK